MAQNPAGFRLCNSSWLKTRRVLGFAIHHSAKPGGFRALQFIMAQNPAGFRLCNSSWSKTRRVLGFAIHHGSKPGGFWALQFIIEQNPLGFGADLIFFSCLDTRKEDKEDQGLTEAGEISRIHDLSKKVPGKTSLPRQGPSLDGRKEAKEDQGLTEARELGRIRVEIENVSKFSPPPRSTTTARQGAELVLISALRTS